MTPPAVEGHSADSYPWFDWARFALASVVALAHQGLIEWPRAGNLAVQVFFALSGWLIGAILLRTERAGLPEFFYRRATRIWIPYLAAVTVLYGLAFVTGRAGDWPQFLFHDLTFTHNWFVYGPTDAPRMPLDGTGNHFWSISVEEQFYLLAPLLMLFTPVGKRVGTWLVVVAVALVAAPSYFAAIALGVLAAVVQVRVGDWHLSRTARGGLLVGAVVAGAVTVAYDGLYHHAAPFFAIAVILLLATRGRRGGVGRFLGAVSYPMYLNHWMGTFVGNALDERTTLPPLVIHVVSYGLAVAAGIAAYLLIDRVVLARRQELYTPQRGLVLAGTAYCLFAAGFVVGLAAWPDQFPVLHDS